MSTIRDYLKVESDSDIDLDPDSSHLCYYAPFNPEDGADPALEATSLTPSQEPNSPFAASPMQQGFRGPLPYAADYQANSSTLHHTGPISRYNLAFHNRQPPTLSPSCLAGNDPQSPQTESDIYYKNNYDPLSPSDVKIDPSVTTEAPATLSDAHPLHSAGTINPKAIHFYANPETNNLENGAAAGHRSQCVSALPFLHAQTSFDHSWLHNSLGHAYPRPPSEHNAHLKNEASSSLAKKERVLPIKEEDKAVKLLSLPLPSFSEIDHGLCKPLFQLNNDSHKLLPLKYFKDVKDFKDYKALGGHKQAKHIRIFGCVFAFAGCTSRISAKNERKRHVMTQHVAEKYCVCSHLDCVPVASKVFRRKDLFSQHYSRMHFGQTGRGRCNLTPKQVVELEASRKRSVRRRPTCPSVIRCPAPGCDAEFRGKKLWRDSLDHIDTHLAKSREAESTVLDFGGPENARLRSWASSEEVGIIKSVGNAWKLCNLNLALVRNGSKENREDSDAEGEECT